MSDILQISINQDTIIFDRVNRRRNSIMKKNVNNDEQKMKNL